MLHIQAFQNVATRLKIFEQNIVVSNQHLDDLSHVNNVVYVQWVQDVAKSHWEQDAPNEIQMKYIWMVLRHEIDYIGQSNSGDVLIAKTWVAWSEGVKSERHVEILNQKTEKILVKAKTLWCLLDAKTRRPSRIGNEITDVFH